MNKALEFLYQLGLFTAGVIATIMALETIALISSMRKFFEYWTRPIRINSTKEIELK